MKFSVGDKVLLKQTQEEGRVTAVLNDEMVEVEVLNTHFPAFTDELEHPYLNWFSTKKMNTKKRALTLEDFPATMPVPKVPATGSGSVLANGMYHAFLPVYHFDKDEDIIAKIKLYFINQTAYNLQMKYDCVTEKGTQFSFGTTLLPYQHLYLHHIPYDMINDKLRFNFQIFQKEDPKKTGDIENQIKIKPKQIFQKIKQIEENNQPLFHFLVAEDFPDLNLAAQTKELAFSMPKPSNSYQFKTTFKKKDAAIDLHIENLLDNYSDLDNFEILQLQLQAFEDALQKAIHFQQASLIVIHGLGTGKLREEIHNVLKKRKKEVKHFENKYSQKYGFGATEIFFYH